MLPTGSHIFGAEKIICSVTVMWSDLDGLWGLQVDIQGVFLFLHKIKVVYNLQSFRMDNRWFLIIFTANKQELMWTPEIWIELHWIIHKLRSILMDLSWQEPEYLKPSDLYSFCLTLEQVSSKSFKWLSRYWAKIIQKMHANWPFSQ